VEVYLSGQRLRLDPARALGQGGEAEVFDLGDGRALKVFKGPDHPDYQGSPAEQRAAEQRLFVHQQKLPGFPRGLPAPVVAPQELATDRSGRRVLGFAMPLVRPAEPLLRYADPAFRRGHVGNAQMVRLFRELHGVVEALHRRGVVIGDFNDLNILVTASVEPRVIDADSFQFGDYRCQVFTERFVDPRLCAPGESAPRLCRPYDEDADWYAFTALLMQSLLFVGPFGGVYRPRRSPPIPHGARPLHGITVFHPEVRYPKPAARIEILPDGLLQHLRRVFEGGRRGPFPVELLETLRFRTCPGCAAEHAGTACPLCAPAPTAAPVQTVRGQVRCDHLFRTGGTIVCACVEAGALRFLHHHDGAYRREDGRMVLEGPLDHRLRFGILGATTLVASGHQLTALSPGGRELLSVDTDGSGPAFASNGRHLYWTDGGRLQRGGPGRFAGELVGEVLAGQTRIWAGPTFGLGLYRASQLAVAFTFAAERRGINDTLRLPALRGQLVDATCVLDQSRAWLLLALHTGGRTLHRCLVYSAAGSLEGTAEAEAGDGSWLGTLHGKCATRGSLLAASDLGITRIEPRDGALAAVRLFPDTEPFVDGASRLLPGADRLYVVGPRTITTLTINGT